jgi:hypothetical protein
MLKFINYLKLLFLCFLKLIALKFIIYMFVVNDFLLFSIKFNIYINITNIKENISEFLEIIYNNFNISL